MKKVISEIKAIFLLFFHSFIHFIDFAKSKILRRRNVRMILRGFQFAGFYSSPLFILNLNYLSNKLFYAIIFITLIYYNGCKDNNPVVPPTKNDNTFAIYFLKDTTLTIKDILNTNLADLVLADKPWISQEDINFYDWSSHCIYLKKDKSYFFPNYYEGYYALPKSWTDRPWIVVANSIRCYKGYFVTDASVDIFPFPEISALEAGTWGYPKDIITSDWIFWFFHSDPRNNELVKESLFKSGLYHGGIEVSLDTTNSPIKVLNNDTTTVEYTLKIKNNDQDDLYVFDPGKIDDEIYNYYTNGPNFINVETHKSYGSQYEKSKKPDVWDSNWYTFLKSGEYIIRTIKNNGYPFIPAATYLAQCGYVAHRLEKNMRETQLGRYWLGQTRTDTVRLKIMNFNKNVER